MGVPKLTAASGRLIARNTLLILAGQGIPLLIGVLAIPATVRLLGTERFGLLGLGWTVVGYFSVLDLGMSRAATRFVADAIGRDAPDEIPALTWSAVAIQVVLGFLGAILLVSVAPFIVGRVLHVPSALQPEARTAFRVLAAGVPMVLVAASFRGVLEAAQRFDLVNAVSIPGSALNFLVPLVGAFSGLDIAGIFAWLVVARLGTLIAYLALAARLFPQLRRGVEVRGKPARSLLRFGAWTTVSGIISPILDQLDRVLLGALAGVASVAYYAAPQEIVLRIRVLPTALASALFPEFSAQPQRGAGRSHEFYGLGVRFLALTLAPVTLGMVLLGPDILRLWLGPEFARQSGGALRFLAIGVFANALAYVPLAFLHGINRPDVPAMFHVLELPFFLTVAWLLMPRYGPAGAGAAWAARATLDSILLHGAVARRRRAERARRAVSTGGWVWVVLFGMLVALGFLPVLGAIGAAGRVAGTIVVGSLVFVAGWRWLLQEDDRNRVIAAWQRLKAA